MSTHPTATPAQDGQVTTDSHGNSYTDLGPGAFGGNLTKAPELRFTSEGKPIAVMRLADTPRVKDPATGQWADGATVYADVQVWNQAAYHAVEHLIRGDRVAAVGRWQSRKWHNSQGEQHERISLIARDLGPSLLFKPATVHRDWRPDR